MDVIYCHQKNISFLLFARDLEDYIESFPL